MFTAQDHTFVVCAYKESSYLEELIKSLEAQTVQSSVLVSTSTPNCFIDAICKHHDLNLIVNEGETSIARDWNYGYDHAQTRLVTIAHQDDVYEPRYLEAVLGALNADEGDVGVLHTDYYEMRSNERVEANRILHVKRLMNKMLNGLMAGNSVSAKRRGLSFGNCICCPSVTFNKDVVGSAVFDVQYANSCDYRTWINLANRNVRFLYVPEMLMGHRIHAESTTTLNIESSIRSTEDSEIFESLWPRPIAHAIFSLYSTSEKSNK